MPAWLQISLRKWLSTWCKSYILAAILLCKLDGQELKIPLGNRVFRIQHTQIRLKSLVPNFYSKMLLTFTYFINLTSLYTPLIVQAMGVKYSMDCSLFDKKIILGSIILQTILIIFRGGAIEYLLFLGNGC